MSLCTNAYVDFLVSTAFKPSFSHWLPPDSVLIHEEDALKPNYTTCFWKFYKKYMYAVLRYKNLTVLYIHLKKKIYADLDLCKEVTFVNDFRNFTANRVCQYFQLLLSNYFSKREYLNCLLKMA